MGTILTAEVATTTEVGESRQWIAAWVGIAIVTVLAIWRLRDFPYHLSWIEAFRGMWEVLPTTLWAAVRIWTFWAWGAAVLAGLILRIDPEIDLADVILGGLSGMWVLGYFLGIILGPLHLFNTATLWSLLALGTIWLWYHPPRIPWRPLSTGEKLALLAVALLAVSMLPLQLASPVAPFMDVLAIPSAAQRVVTFGVYLPFDNDAYGVWIPTAEAMGLELFLAMLADGANLHFAAGALAHSQAMLPIAGLLMFATWRLGKTLFNDAAGGIAALLLFWTCLLRRAQGVRGAVAVLVLMALGLAFFLDPSRRRTLMALGAMLLATAVGSYSLLGGFGMIVASVGVLFWLLEGDSRGFVAGVLYLAGASLITVPQLALSLQLHLPYLVLAGSVALGVAVIVVNGTRLPLIWPLRNPRTVRILNTLLIAAFVVLALRRQDDPLLYEISGNMPLLSALFVLGIVIAPIVSWRDNDLVLTYVGFPALAVAFAFAGGYVDMLAHTPLYSKTILWNVLPKLTDFWCPYFLLFPAGFAVALAYERWSRPLVFFVLLAILIYPVHMIKNPVDYDSAEHSIAEHWAFNLHQAAESYWVGAANGRWLLDGNGIALAKLLMREVAAGRITPATHILHLSEDTSAWGLAQVAIYTGIDDDPIDFHYDPNNNFEFGSRVRGPADLPAALARRPPYILEARPGPAWIGDPPAGYEEIFERGQFRLYRRDDLVRNAGK